MFGLNAGDEGVEFEIDKGFEDGVSGDGAFVGISGGGGGSR